MIGDFDIINEIFPEFFCGSDWSSGRFLDIRIEGPEVESWAMMSMLFFKTVGDASIYK